MAPQERREFGLYLLGLRKTKGLTQRQAGQKAEISCPYLAQLERGQRNPPSRDKLANLAAVYGVSPELMFKKAGYSDDNKSRVVPKERIEWAFEAVRRDPDYTFGTRLIGEELSLEAKAFIIELYHKATGVDLLVTGQIGSIHISDRANASEKPS